MFDSSSGFDFVSVLAPRAACSPKCPAAFLFKSIDWPLRRMLVFHIFSTPLSGRLCLSY